VLCLTGPSPPAETGGELSRVTAASSSVMTPKSVNTAASVSALSIRTLLDDISLHSGDFGKAEVLDVTANLTTLDTSSPRARMSAEKRWDVGPGQHRHSRSTRASVVSSHLLHQFILPRPTTNSHGSTVSLHLPGRLHTHSDERKRQDEVSVAASRRSRATTRTSVRSSRNASSSRSPSRSSHSRSPSRSPRYSQRFIDTENGGGDTRSVRSQRSSVTRIQVSPARSQEALDAVARMVREVSMLAVLHEVDEQKSISA
jgi:hypothetical protein